MSSFILPGLKPPDDVKSSEDVKRYQRRIKVKADGVWGPHTQAEYMAYMNRGQVARPTTSPEEDSRAQQKWHAAIIQAIGADTQRANDAIYHNLPQVETLPGPRINTVQKVSLEDWQAKNAASSCKERAGLTTVHREPKTNAPAAAEPQHTFVLTPLAATTVPKFWAQQGKEQRDHAGTDLQTLVRKNSMGMGLSPEEQAWVDQLGNEIAAHMPENGLREAASLSYQPSAEPQVNGIGQQVYADPDFVPKAERVQAIKQYEAVEYAPDFESVSSQAADIIFKKVSYDPSRMSRSAIYENYQKEQGLPFRIRSATT